MGSFGPSHENPKTNKIYGTDFPVITINDMVNAQLNLLDFFGIKKLFSVVGGSMGGMQVLQFISNYPDKAKTAIPIACTSSHSAQNICLYLLTYPDLLHKTTNHLFWSLDLYLLQIDHLLKHEILKLRYLFPVSYTHLTLPTIYSV